MELDEERPAGQPTNGAGTAEQDSTRRDEQEHDLETKPRDHLPIVHSADARGGGERHLGRDETAADALDGADGEGLRGEPLLVRLKELAGKVGQVNLVLGTGVLPQLQLKT